MCKRRKLQRKSVVDVSIEPKTDTLSINLAKTSPLETKIEYGIDDGVQGPVISVDKHEKDLCSIHRSVNSELQSASSDNELIAVRFSSVKSESEVGSTTTRTKIGDTIQCPDSESEVLGEELSIRDLCISVLRSHGLLVGDWPAGSAYSKVLGNSKDDNVFQCCQLCGNLENTLNMLLCDHCEEAFHVSCCYPKTKVLPTDEWFCQSCSKLSNKVSLETSFLKSRDTSWRNGTSRFELGPIAFALKYPELHTSRVRIGESFQAAVPEWSDQIAKDYDSIGEPLEMDPAETVGLHNEGSTNKFPKPNSVSNWLQCREVMYDNAREHEGTICGKWRRAPLSEVQTDDWDCFCSVLWDPSHSDCAAPQELETDQVLLQLEYIEQLRSRLSTRKRT